MKAVHSVVCGNHPTNGQPPPQKTQFNLIQKKSYGTTKLPQMLGQLSLQY